MIGESRFQASRDTKKCAGLPLEVCDEVRGDDQLGHLGGFVKGLRTPAFRITQLPQPLPGNNIELESGEPTGRILIEACGNRFEKFVHEMRGKQDCKGYRSRQTLASLWI